MNEETFHALEAFAETGAMPITPPILGAVHRLGVLDHPTPTKRAGEIVKLHKEYRHLVPGPTNPTDWTKGVMTTGREVEFKITHGAGRNAGKEYLHIRWKMKMNLRSIETKEIISSWQEWYEVALNLQSYEMKEVA